MKYFLINKKKIVKYLEIILIFIFLSVGVYAYERNKFIISNFESYYLPAYKDLVRSIIEKKEADSEINGEKVRGVPVLVYYGILSDEDFRNLDEKDKAVYVSFSGFREQMRALKDAGWQTISINELRKFIAGEVELSGKPFVLTFNNARKNNFYPVDPILNSLDYNAIMFAITDNSFSDNVKRHGFYLTQDEFKYMLRTGRWSIESYGQNNPDHIVVNHKNDKASPLGNKLWIASENRLETDDEFFIRSSSNLLDSKEIIKRSLNTQVTGFAFPFKYVGLDSKNYPNAQNVVLGLSKLIYPLSFYQVSHIKSDILNYPGSDGLVKQLIINDSFSGKQLAQFLEASKSKSLPFEDSLENDQQWKKSWGNIVSEDGILNIKSAPDSMAAYLTLEGTALWRNYFFEMDIIKKAQSKIALFGYMNDRDNYSCVISDEFLEMQKHNNQKIKLLARYKLVEKINLENLFRFGLGRNSNGELSCRVGNQLYVANGSFVGDDISGKVGLQVWSENLGGVNIDIDNFVAKNGSFENQNLLIAGKEFLQSNDIFDKNSSKNIEYKKILVPYKWTANSEEKWERNWGDVSLSENGLSVSSFTDSTGAFAILPGTDLFQNKTNLIFNVDWQGSNVVFVYRYQDDKNYGAVNIHNDYIRIVEMVDGKSKIIKEQRKIASKSSKKGFYKRFLTVKITLDEKTVNVWINGEMIVSSKNKSKLPLSGTIGIKGWSKKVGESKIILKSLLVETRK